MEMLTIIVVNNRFKVYRDMGNGKRSLLATFKTAAEAERFVNAR